MQSEAESDGKAPGAGGMLLLQQVRRFIRLRWIAGAVVLAGAAVAGPWLGWYATGPGMATVGAGILVYNVALGWVVGAMEGHARGGSGAARPAAPRAGLVAVAWAQLLLDFGALTALTVMTGGLESPVRGFFVFHMVFASLLLRRTMAYAGAAVAMLLMAGALWSSGQWPAGSNQGLVFLGWAGMLLITVWVSNGITRDLRRHRRKLVRQNRRVRRMSRRLVRQQEALIQNEKLASAGRMAAGVAHEIANPLASMDGLLQMMQRRPEKSRPEALETLREQVARVNQIVRRMTAFARPGEGSWEEGNVDSVVDRAMEVLRFDPRFKRVKLERVTGEGMPAVRMQADAVQQVVVNLVINALDALEGAAEPRLTIRTGFSEGWCVIEVGDNGSGIAAEHRRRLFEPFFTTKPVGKGTGLGLSISYSLVKEHGGEIRVQSRPGEGAKFLVCLPAKQTVPVGDEKEGERVAG